MTYNSIHEAKLRYILIHSIIDEANKYVELINNTKNYERYKGKIRMKWIFELKKTRL